MVQLNPEFTERNLTSEDISSFPSVEITRDSFCLFKPPLLKLWPFSKTVNVPWMKRFSRGKR